MNPYANQISIAVLDEQAYLSFYNGNTNFPGSEVQHVHLDNPHLWPDAEHATPAYSLVVNIPTSECTLKNGAIELWPGTHNICLAGAPDEQQISKRRARRPPVRVLTEKGDLMIRDARLWHRGIPNKSDRPRYMIALVHVVGWMAKAGRLKSQSGCEEALEGHGFDSNAEYTEKPIDYLLGPSKVVLERRLSSMRVVDDEIGLKSSNPS